MKGFQKLALAAAIAAAPFAAQAELTAMDDSLLSEMTGQAGVTLDLNLDMSIAEIRYTDEDGSTDIAGNSGYLTLSNIVINGDQGNGTQAEITGVTIDVDGTEGIVIGLGQIGGESTANQASDLLAISTSDYWTGVNVSADLGINGVSAGSVAVKNFTNYVPNALAYEAVSKFGYTLGADIQLTNDDASFTNLTAFAGAAAGIAGEVVDDGDGITSHAEWDTATNVYLQETNGLNGFATALAAGNYVDASISISAGGAIDSSAVADTAQGLTISAVAGFVIEELTYTDDENSMGLHNFVMFDTDDTTGEITGFKITGLTIDVVDHANANSGEALRIGGLDTNGSIAIGDIFIGDAATGSLGAVAIKDISMVNTEIFVYGH